MTAIANKKPETNWSPTKPKPEASAVRPGRETTSPREARLSDRTQALETSDKLQNQWKDAAGIQESTPDQLSDMLRNQWNFAEETPVDKAAPYRSETKQPLEGYDQTKLDNPDHRTPKYLFGRVAQNFKLDSVQSDKGRAEELLKAMAPDLQAAGLEVVGVSGDKIQVKTELGYEWVDVIRGTGAPGPGWQWGSEGAGTPEPTKTVQEWAARTGAGKVPAAAGGAPADHGPKVLGAQIDSGKVLAILKRYPPTGQGLTQAVKDPALQQLYPGVMTFGGGKNGRAFNADDRLQKGLNVDKIYFPNGAIVDVITSGGAANAAWGWMPEN